MAIGRIKPLEQVDPPEGGGTITSVVWQKKDPNRCSIHLDNAFAFGLHATLVMEKGLRKGMVLPEKECRNLLQQDLHYRAMGRIMRFIGYRPRSEREVRQRLAQLGVDEGAADGVVGKLTDIGLLNDVDFGRLYASSRLKKHGPNRVRMDLVRKGLPSDTANSIVVQCLEEVDIDAQLDELVGKAVTKYRRETDERQRNRKIMRWLLSKGHEADAIRDAMRRSL